MTFNAETPVVMLAGYDTTGTEPVGTYRNGKESEIPHIGGVPMVAALAQQMSDLGYESLYMIGPAGLQQAVDRWLSGRTRQRVELIHNDKTMGSKLPLLKEIAKDHPGRMMYVTQNDVLFSVPDLLKYERFVRDHIDASAISVAIPYRTVRDVGRKFSYRVRDDDGRVERVCFPQIYALRPEHARLDVAKRIAERTYAARGKGVSWSILDRAVDAFRDEDGKLPPDVEPRIKPFKRNFWLATVLPLTNPFTGKGIAPTTRTLAQVSSAILEPEYQDGLVVAIRDWPTIGYDGDFNWQRRKLLRYLQSDDSFLTRGTKELLGRAR